MICKDCGRKTVIGWKPAHVRAYRQRCKRWTCDRCAKLNARKVRHLALGGEPCTFLTLTVRPGNFATPNDAADALIVTFQSLMRLLKRRYADHDLAFLAIWEKTKAGWPHLHVLMRAPFIPQRLISEYMKEHIGSPIVHIQYINNATKAVRYVCKYISKSLATFGRHRRYWRSRNWLTEAATNAAKEWLADVQSFTWIVVGKPLEYIEQKLLHLGYTVKSVEDALIAHAPREDLTLDPIQLL